MGHPARYDLARSGAPSRSVAELLDLAGPHDFDEYVAMSLDYGSGTGTERLRDAIACVVGAHAGDVVVTVGAVEGLLLSCAAALGRRSEIAVAVPAYEGLVRAVEAAGGRPCALEVWRPASPRLDLTALLELDLSRYAAVVLNSPHNPSGLIASVSDLRVLAERCEQSGAILVLDQVSLGTLDDRAESFGRHSCEIPPSVVLVGDVSKAYGLGGLRVGWCVTRSTSLRSRIAELRDLTTLATAGPSQLLASIALENRRSLSASALARSNLARLEAWITSLEGAQWVRPADGLVAFCGLPITCSSLEFASMLRVTHEVSVLPGSFFGHEGHVRIGLGVPRQEFAQAVDRLDSATAQGK
jgi:aspartate/methionine/tyrosine aminotransferase